jgi:hypothetical protein
MGKQAEGRQGGSQLYMLIISDIWFATTENKWDINKNKNKKRLPAPCPRLIENDKKPLITLMSSNPPSTLKGFHCVTQEPRIAHNFDIQEVDNL